MNTLEWVHYTVHNAEMEMLKRRCDQLREALESIVECWDGPLYKHEMLPRIQQARAALKATEEG